MVVLNGLMETPNVASLIFRHIFARDVFRKTLPIFLPLRRKRTSAIFVQLAPLGFAVPTVLH